MSGGGALLFGAGFLAGFAIAPFVVLGLLRWLRGRR